MVVVVVGTGVVMVVAGTGVVVVVAGTGVVVVVVGTGVVVGAAVVVVSSVGLGGIVPWSTLGVGKYYLCLSIK